VVASNGRDNLKGEAKARELAARFGEKGFDYVGNDRHDLPVWNRAREAIRVGRRAHPYGALARGLRLHQWPKNLLVFVPLLTSHRILEPQALAIGSARLRRLLAHGLRVYLANDLVDLDDDRRHPRKRTRPVAAGELPIETAVGLIPVLAVGAAVVALHLPPEFWALLAGYVVANLLYSLGLKRIVLVDAFVLAALYTCASSPARPRGGAGVALAARLSLFAFLSLAFAKRFVEVSTSRRARRPPWRGAATSRVTVR
jgi:4-hydroxybenzoate polyprenyltransferase